MLEVLSIRAEAATPKDDVARNRRLGGDAALTIVVWTMRGAKAALPAFMPAHVEDGILTVRVAHVDTEWMYEVGRRAHVDPAMVSTNSEPWMAWALAFVPLVSGGQGDFDPLPLANHVEEVEDEDEAAGEDEVEAAGEEQSDDLEEQSDDLEEQSDDLEEQSDDPEDAVEARALVLAQSTYLELRALLKEEDSPEVVDEALAIERARDKPRATIVALLEARLDDIWATTTAPEESAPEPAATDAQTTPVRVRALERDFVRALEQLVDAKGSTYTKRLAHRELNKMVGGGEDGPLFHEPGKVFTATKRHRNDWQKVAYTIRCLPDGAWELVDYRSSPSSPKKRDDLVAGTVYETGKALLQAVSGRETPGASVHAYFRLS